MTRSGWNLISRPILIKGIDLRRVRFAMVCGILLFYESQDFRRIGENSEIEMEIL